MTHIVISYAEELQRSCAGYLDITVFLTRAMHTNQDDKERVMRLCVKVCYFEHFLVELLCLTPRFLSDIGTRKPEVTKNTFMWSKEKKRMKRR